MLTLQRLLRNWRPSGRNWLLVFENHHSFLIHFLVVIVLFFTPHIDYCTSQFCRSYPIIWLCHINCQVYNLQEHQKPQAVIHSGPCCPLYLQELDSSLETLTTAFEKATSEKIRFQEDVNCTTKTIELANRLVKGLEVSNKLETGLNVNKVVFRHFALL